MRFLPALLVLAGLNAYGSDVAGRQADLDFVANQVPKLHANFFYQLDPTVYQAAADALAADLPNLTDFEFYDRLAALIAMAGDPHTAIYLNSTAATNSGFQSFPLVLTWLDDGVFVTGAAAPYARALGTQLVAIAGTSIDEAVQAAAALVPHNNPQWLEYELQTYLRGQQILQGLHVAPPGETTPLTFRAAAGETFTLDVAPDVPTGLASAPDPNTGPYPWYLEGSNQLYWFGYSAANRVLYFKYNVCMNGPVKPFAPFAATLLATLDANPVDTVVLDLRGNVGGDSSVWQPLLDGLSQRMPALTANPAFRVYGVIDKGTFSSGSLDAMQIRGSIPQVLMIGEPTGGATGGWGNVVGFTLPGSGLTGQYSTKWISGPSYVTPGPDYPPDIRIGTRSADFFARHDPVIAAILARTDQPPSAPSGSAILVNGASRRMDQGIAPESYAAVLGDFSDVPDEVTVGGAAAQVLKATTSEADILVPPSMQPGSAAISVRVHGAELASGQATITAAGPGLFVAAADSAQPGAVNNEDGSPNTSANPAATGSVIAIYATGGGPADASGSIPVSVFFAAQPAEVVASVPVSDYPGLWQINARVPLGATGLTGRVPVFVVAQSLASNAVTVAIR
jgi:uncharacterized protein (TIGR03437 family)